MDSADAEGVDANSSARCEGFKRTQQTQMRAQTRIAVGMRESDEGLFEFSRRRGGRSNKQHWVCERDERGCLGTADAEEGAGTNSTGSAREV